MKALFIIDSLANAGTEKSYLKLLPRFSNDLEVEVVYFYPDHYLLGAFEKANLPVHFLNIDQKYGFRQGIKRLLELVKEVQPDLMVSSLLRSNLVSRVVSRITGIPLVGTLVSDSYGKVRLESMQGKGLLKFKLFWLLDRWSARIPVHWIANSAFIADSHCESLRIKRQKITVVYRGREVPGRLCEKVVSSGGTSTINFVSIGRLLNTKGWLDLLEAFALVRRERSDCTMTIFGEGALRKSMESRIEELGLTQSVSLPGNVPQVQERLYDYDCFVFPSWYEGFSGALIEAMMVGIPIIASDIPMNLEAITPNENALTFPIKDPSMLAAQMIYAINNPLMMAKMGENARQEAIERFDIVKIAKEYEGVLRKVVTPPGLP
ncbi:glycosyltransferase family 4 protein [Echinicola vietnamensis]|uniref:Glycosyltransferase n=1 Tax=Echinicola vietnamensis (strain DSM 17526 / LMG 23754 / KMM 6221) TaxID=926556 RepID=L0FY49_ECHVK|nr:glycosyltransferase family 4 protein [Echinicola vietnamensis]AGA78844.1 glycosyltransferase [Echinicola vietnamensis DSM 17526]